MFQRNALEKLKEWSTSTNRKPLILRGARQVGKTTLVDIFSKSFNKYLYLNLENKEEWEIFENSTSITELLASLFFIKGIPLDEPKVLIFIDEIQNSPKAVAWLRYFYEKAPEYYIIAAGSLLETLIDTQISFPVGRVSYLPVKPFSFSEFILALGEKQITEALKTIPFPEYAHNKLLQQFEKYALIGGMPEIIKNYVERKDVVSLSPIYDELLTSYKDDIEKYSKSHAQTQSLRHVANNIFQRAGNRVKYQGFGNSNYKSREMKDAFVTLEKAFLLNLIFPVTQASLPLTTSYKKAPKLQVLDTGLINYVSGIQEEFFRSKQLTDIYKGKIAEHVVGQELAAGNYLLHQATHFWTKEKTTEAEVDYVYPFKGLLIPIEVKAGKSGKLRSLHEYMEEANHKFAVRVFSGKLSITKAYTRTKKEYHLLNLPFYLVHKIEEYLNWFINKAAIGD